VDGEKLYLVQELISNPKDSNFMVISIQHDRIFADLDNLSEHVAVYIEDAKQHVIFQENHEHAAVAAGSKVDDDVLHTEVIHFILQPIVENAIKHGFVEADASDLIG